MIVYPGILIWNAPISGNTAQYSAPSLAPLLARASKLLFQARTAQGSGTNPTLTVDIEKSNDGLNYSSVGANAPINAVSVSTTGVTNAFAQWDSTASDNLFGCFLRVKISLGGTTPSANVRVTVTGRAKRPRGEPAQHRNPIAPMNGAKPGGCTCDTSSAGVLTRGQPVPAIPVINGSMTPSANIRVAVAGRSKRPRGVGNAAHHIAADAWKANVAAAGGKACGCHGGKGSGSSRRQATADPDPRFGPTPPPPNPRQRLAAGLSSPLGYGFRPERRCPPGVIPSPDCFRYFPVSDACPARCSYFAFGSGCCILEGADGRSFGFCARPGECSFQCGVQFSDPADVMHCYKHYRFDPGVVLCDDIC